MLNALADDFTIKILIGERLALVLWDHYLWYWLVLALYVMLVLARHRKLVKAEKGTK